jgi:Sugar-transfer associated ATP-grasp
VGKQASVGVFATIERRPDTGAAFREMIVPLWQNVRATVTKAALAFSDLRTVGWDVAVTDDGVSILEANWDWGENLIEVAHNRGLRNELTELTRRSLSSAGK